MNNGEILVFNGLVELGSKMTVQIQPNGCRITDADIDAALYKFPEFIEVARQRPDCLLLCGSCFGKNCREQGA